MEVGTKARNKQTGDVIVWNGQQWIPEGRDEGINKALGIASSAGQGLSFGWSDEIAAGLAAPFAAWETGNSLGDAYAGVLEQARKRQDQFAEENPGTAFASELAGGLLTGGAGGAKVLAAKGVQALPKFAQYGLLGAGAGGVAGAGHATEGNRLEGTGIGSTIGAATGMLAQPIVSGVGAVVKPVAQRFAGPGTQAKSKLLQAMSRDEMPPNRVLAGIRGLGDDATMADAAGDNVLGLARAVTATPGAAKNAARQTLGGRAAGQRERIIDSVKRLVNIKSDDIYQVADDLDQQMATVAKPYYQQAYAAEVPVSDTLSGYLSRIPKAAVNNALKLAKMEGDDLSTAVVRDEDGKIVHIASLKLWDYLKRSLDDSIGAAQRAGNKNLARIYSNVKNGFVSELDDMVPEYGKARALYADPARNKEALELGRKILGQDAEISAKQIGSMSDAEKEMFRMGAVRAIVDRLKSGRTEGSVLGKIDSPRVMERIRAAFPNEDAARTFINTIKREARFAYTKDKVLGGSPTARITAEVDDATRPVSALSEAVQGNYATAAKQMLDSATRQDSIPEPVKQELAKLLFTKGYQGNKPLMMELLRQADPKPIPPYVGAGLLGGSSNLMGGGMAR